ncbi:AraC family transcriptional regulator [Paenibacillus sp. YN15]|uniref:AraC family transcriptional regulator n=1 Tax=Paenibacillus sp. YN15 TaxID=1742774 RepID=UPI00215C7810|nr:AraC family transcriptional regulator [Paenibacillus sp. YN15]
MEEELRPALRESAFREWSPGIHYAKHQELRPCSFPVRRLYDFELLYVGNGEMETDMSGAVHRITAGQLIVLPSGVFHQNRIVAGEPARLMGIHFDFFDELRILQEEDMVVDEERGAQPGKFAAEAVAEGCMPLSREPVHTPSSDCVQWMEQLVQEFTMRSPGYELVCKGLMMNILASLVRARLAGQRAEATVHGERIRSIMGEIELHPAGHWSNTAIAAKLNVHEDHMSKLFRQVTGMPPGEYVRTVRLREARRLLGETDWSVEQVGEAVGYPDLHYFSRIFSAHEGISPRAFRKLARML